MKNGSILTSKEKKILEEQETNQTELKKLFAE
jgi:hypothetical protein